MNEHAAITSYLLAHHWHETAVTEAASAWTKGEALVVVPYSIERNTLTWQQVLVGLSSVEHEPVWSLGQEIGSVVAAIPVPEAQSTRIELDLHLDGPGVRNHETDAHLLGQFLTHVAEAVNELVKDTFGLKRHFRNLQIVGSAHQGSVQVRFREPESGVEEQDSLVDVNSVSPEAQALVNFVQILGAADRAAQRPVDSLLDAHLRLDPGARRALGQVADVVLKAGWNANGYLIRPDDNPVPVSLTLAGANRLSRAAQDSTEHVTTVSMLGHVDGWTWSTAEMRFIADDGEAIRAAVLLGQQHAVAHLGAEPDARAEAKFQVLERHGPKGQIVRRQHVLLDITPLSTLPSQQPDAELVTSAGMARV